MNCIRVNTGTSYDVLIRHGILRDAGKEIMKVMPNARLAVVTDSNVSPLYLAAPFGFSGTGRITITPPSFTMAAAEDTKSLKSSRSFIQAFTQPKISRDCCLSLLAEA